MRLSCVLSRIPGALPLLLCLALAIAAARLAGAESFVIIVNAANPVSGLTSQEVSDLFLKKAATWPDGTKAAPVDLAEGAPSRDSFSKSVHQKSTAAVKAFWQKMIFSGRDVPPPEKASADEVVSFVKAHHGGVGYVPAGTRLGAGVKVVNLKP